MNPGVHTGVVHSSSIPLWLTSYILVHCILDFIFCSTKLKVFLLQETITITCNEFQRFEDSFKGFSVYTINLGIKNQLVQKHAL
jgi:hypothetical protein